MSKTVKGTLYTVVAGIAWGLSGTSGQYLMAHGISALVLTNLRLIIAGLALVFLSYLTAKDKLYAFLKDRKSLLSLLLFALFGLFLNKTKEQHEADSVSLQDRVTDVASSTGEFASEQFEKVKSGIGSGVAAVQEKVGEGVEAVKGEAKENARVH